MAVPAWISERFGAFSGRSELWLDPTAPPIGCDSTASLAPRAGEVAFEVAYQWSYEGRLASGLVTVHVDASGVARASFTDSWHLRDSLMACEGTSESTGISVTGAYAAPPGPDWGWRITLEPAEDLGLRLQMFNRAPDGAEALAVACDYRRVARPLGEVALGAFSVSLAVQDLAASEAFYTALGFERAGGDPTQGWLILRSGSTTIGLFRGMFDRNLLTFNPGWTPDAAALLSFPDVRALHSRAVKAGLPIGHEAGLDGAGPASFVVIDPDGNPILFDQHVATSTIVAS